MTHTGERLEGAKNASLQLGTWNSEYPTAPTALYDPASSLNKLTCCVGSSSRWFVDPHPGGAHPWADAYSDRNQTVVVLNEVVD